MSAAWEFVIWSMHIDAYYPFLSGMQMDSQWQTLAPSMLAQRAMIHASIDLTSGDGAECRRKYRENLLYVVEKRSRAAISRRFS